MSPPVQVINILGSEVNTKITVYKMTRSSLLAGKTEWVKQATCEGKNPCILVSAIFYMICGLHFLICKTVSFTTLGAAGKMKWENTVTVLCKEYSYMQANLLTKITNDCRLTTICKAIKYSFYCHLFLDLLLQIILKIK